MRISLNICIRYSKLASEYIVRVLFTKLVQLIDSSVHNFIQYLLTDPNTPHISTITQYKVTAYFSTSCDDSQSKPVIALFNFK